MQRLLSFLIAGALALALVGCGDDDVADDTSTGDESSDQVGKSADNGEDDAGTDDSGEAADGSGGGGTLIWDGEEIALDSSQCTFEEQEAAAGGGTIEFVAQATGSTEAGDDVLIDVSRYSEESQFAGDDVSINIGDYATGASFRGNEPAGAVSEDGSTVEASDFPMMSDEDFSDERTVSFSIDCG